jgi:type II secretory pathway pseudopilin PulG
VTAGLGSGRGAFARRSRDANARDEEGFTLVEILITLWIMGAVMVALIGALFTMTKASDLSKRTTIAETELRRYAEAVRAVPYTACQDADTYETAITNAGLYTPPTGFTVTPNIVSVKYWTKGSSFNSSAFVATHPSCDGTANETDDGAQQFAITVQLDGTPAITLPLVITKREGPLH